MPKSSAPSESRLAGTWTEVEADGGEQQREGNGERNDDGAAHIAEKEEEDDRDQNHALGQVVLDGLDGELDQIGAVEEGNDLYAFGQNAGDLFELVDFFVNALQHRIGVVALLQQHDAFHGVGIVDNCAVGPMRGAADLAQANLGPLRDGGNVLDA